jgi:hypothetical protein
MEGDNSEKPRTWSVMFPTNQHSFQRLERALGHILHTYLQHSTSPPESSFIETAYHSLNLTRMGTDGIYGICWCLNQVPNNFNAATVPNITQGGPHLQQYRGLEELTIISFLENDLCDYFNPSSDKLSRLSSLCISQEPSSLTSMKRKPPLVLLLATLSSPDCSSATSDRVDGV